MRGCAGLFSYARERNGSANLYRSRQNDPRRTPQCPLKGIQGKGPQPPNEYQTFETGQAVKSKPLRNQSEKSKQSIETDQKLNSARSAPAGHRCRRAYIYPGEHVSCLRSTGCADAFCIVFYASCIGGAHTWARHLQAVARPSLVQVAALLVPLSGTFCADF
jgi:hypothetical protein